MSSLVNVALGSIPTEHFAALVVAPCGSTYVHLVGVDVFQADHVTEVRATTTHRPVTNPGRGSMITCRFFCEAEHTFDLSFSFHKGQTFVYRSDCCPAEWPATLWRD